MQPDALADTHNAWQVSPLSKRVDLAATDAEQFGRLIDAEEQGCLHSDLLSIFVDGVRISPLVSDAWEYTRAKRDERDSTN
jgi:hypothetical protein